jgi:hypothetical protein
MVGIQRLSSGFALFDLCVFACYPTWGYIFYITTLARPLLLQSMYYHKLLKLLINRFISRFK